MWKRTWDIGVVKVVKREINQAIALAVGRKCRKHMSGRFILFIVVPCILTISRLFSPTNAPFIKHIKC